MEDRGLCPECLSPRLVKVGHVWSGRQRKQQYRCLDCGRLTIKPVEGRKPELVSKLA